MSDLIVSMIVIGVTILVIAVIFILVNRSKKQSERKIKELAAAHGWEYEPIRDRLDWGYRLKCTWWILEAVSQSSDGVHEPSQVSVSQTTKIWSPGFSPSGNLVLVGPGSGDLPNLGGLEKMMISKAIDVFIGRHDLDLKVVEAGDPELRKRYLILAVNPEEAQRYLNPTVVRILEDWKAPLPVIKVSEKGFRIDINGRHYKTEKELTALIDLAEIIRKNIIQ